MKKHPFALIAIAAFLPLLPATPVLAQKAESKPVWELSQDAIKPEMIEGTVVVEDGVVKLNGANSFSIPASVLGKQNDYTIEFEVKRPAKAISGPYFRFVSNAEEENKTGLTLQYFPPEYNSLWLMLNGFLAAEERGLSDGQFDKIRIVVKDRQISLFQNDLVTAITSEVKPSSKPLRFGAIEAKSTEPYRFRKATFSLASQKTGRFFRKSGFFSTDSASYHFRTALWICNPLSCS